jgi:hypothetical protein
MRPPAVIASSASSRSAALSDGAEPARSCAAPRAAELRDQLDEHGGVALERDVTLRVGATHEHYAIAVWQQLDRLLQPRAFPVLAVTGGGQDRRTPA